MVCVARPRLYVLARPLTFVFMIDILKIDLLQPVNWDPLAFEQLSMEMERKALLQSLVEFHDKGAAFQDIVARKGRGLVVNLFGKSTMRWGDWVDPLTSFLRPAWNW